MTADATLAAGIAALSLGVDSTGQARLLRYIALLSKWNRTYNLTAVRDPQRMVTHHLLDALGALPHLPRHAGLRLIDIGSGAGIPGIPFAIARRGWQVTLLDSQRKKTAFLRQALAELALRNVEVVTARVEDYTPALPFDVAVSRAFGNLSRFVSAAGRLVRPGGWLVAMKGTYPVAEIEALPASVRVVATPSLSIPGLDAERRLVVMATACR